MAAAGAEKFRQEALAAADAAAEAKAIAVEKAA
jgi:hypothetical protein